MKAIKELNAIEWVRQAVSKDNSRPNLTSVYGTGKEVVATDGNRLHVATVPGLTGYLESPGLDMQFPDWKQAIPVDTASRTVRLNAVAQLDLLNKLDAFLKTCKALGCYHGTECGVEIESCDNKLSFKRDFTRSRYTCSFDVNISDPHGACIPVLCLNARYLYEALLGDSNEVKISFRTPTSAIVVERYSIDGFHRQAIIMPMKKPE